MIPQSYVYSISKWVSGDTAAGSKAVVTKHLIKATREGLFWLMKDTVRHSRKGNVGRI